MTSSNDFWTVKDFNEEFNNFKMAITGSKMKRGDLIHLGTSRIAVLLLSEVLNYI